jgi:hypothetical protein
VLVSISRQQPVVGHRGPRNLQVQRPDGTTGPHTLHSAPGFDNVTGLGVPNGEEFLKAVGEE